MPALMRWWHAWLAPRCPDPCRPASSFKHLNASIDLPRVAYGSYMYSILEGFTFQCFDVKWMCCLSRCLCISCTLISRVHSASRPMVPRHSRSETMSMLQRCVQLQGRHA